MNNLNLTLSSLIGSRICHDLISPIGAINNGLELIELNGAPVSSEMSLIEQSCAAATARIQFFRIAYGTALDGQIISNRETVQIINSAIQSERLAILWHPKNDLPRCEIQLAFLLLQCFETALPYGGTIHVSRKSNTWRISSDADRLEVDPVLWRHLVRASPRTKIAPAHVQFALLPECVSQTGRDLQVDQTEQMLQVTL